MSNVVWAFVALVLVLVLIAAVAWLVRRFSLGNSGANANRGRMPRLAVIDAAAVDGRRRLVLVRRDNVEHLIMIGGPTDVVVEPNIVRSAAQRDQAPLRGPAGTELPARTSPLPDPNWADTESLDHREPTLPELARAPRAPAFPDEGRRPSPPIADWSANDLPSGFTPEPIARNEQPGRAAPRGERTEPSLPRMPRAEAPKAAVSRPPAPARAAEPPLSSADQNLAEMAQRLEAALRRPGSELRLDSADTRGPAVNPADRVGGAPPVPARPVPRPPAAAPTEPATAKPAFDNLEDEMANLLGRTKPPA